LQDHFGRIFAIHVNENQQVAPGVSQTAFQRGMVADVSARRYGVGCRPGLPDFLDFCEGPVRRSVVQKNQIHRIALGELRPDRAKPLEKQRDYALFIVDWAKNG
jgi:hypothetical protein